MVVGIGGDSVHRLQRFGDSRKLAVPLVSDPSGTVARLYDVRRRFGLGTSRVTYVIDREGVIRDAHHNELSPSGHARRALRRVEALPPAGTTRGAPG